MPFLDCNEVSCRWLKSWIDCTYNYDDRRATRQTLHDEVFLVLAEGVIDTRCTNRNLLFVNFDLPVFQLRISREDVELRAAGVPFVLDKSIEEVIQFIFFSARFLQRLWSFCWFLLFWALSTGETRRDNRLQRPLVGRILEPISDMCSRLEQEDRTLGWELTGRFNSITLSPEDSGIVGSGDFIVRSGTATERKDLRDLSEQYQRTKWFEQHFDKRATGTQVCSVPRGSKRA
jgi:hypothetical protein